LQKTVFLFTPPFTQLNTPYPATAYLKGFLNTKNISSYQADLGIDVIVQLFCKKGLTELFHVAKLLEDSTDNAKRIKFLQQDYIDTIDDTILFLQGKNPTIAHLISKRNFLPEASRFIQLDDLDFAFGKMGLQDKAKHLATLYLEDLADFIKECVDEHFGFSRYAERLGRSANTFDELYDELQKEFTFIDEILIKIVRDKFERTQPTLVAISVPFPGNLYSALRCGQWIKKYYPHCKVAMGGGFPNTELRSISDERVFEFVDFITLDDGEMPLEFLIEYIEGKRTLDSLKRTFTICNGVVTYINNNTCSDYKQHELGTPDYTDLPLDQYISSIEVINPMHSMWSDGRWNKLTMAHGCYWGKCTFCDISLDYIKTYEPIAASLICDRMETLIAQTGQNGFHFVDEAAPPALMRSLAIEIIKRKLVVTWWTNVRFEKSFTRDLCLLLKTSGCVAVSGGLEVASDRLLQLIDKGITVAQVAKVTQHFTKAGIMVHAYLMYGFPTQTELETIDSLEMVRQLFEAGVIQSGFWHQFAMTAHSPVGMNPEKYKVIAKKAAVISFADNDVVHEDPTGAQHETFSFGLKKSLLNFMHQAHFDKPLQYWFDMKVPKITVNKDFISNAINEVDVTSNKPTAKVLWLGNNPNVEFFTQSKKGMQREMAAMTFYNKTTTLKIQVPKDEGEWFINMLPQLSIKNEKPLTLQEVKDSFELKGLDNFELFWDNKPMNKLYEVGLLVI
jgi:radical SAM superfamily enzyme YgiQ (UPF0313 family)